MSSAPCTEPTAEAGPAKQKRRANVMTGATSAVEGRTSKRKRRAKATAAPGGGAVDADAMPATEEGADRRTPILRIVLTEAVPRAALCEDGGEGCSFLSGMLDLVDPGEPLLIGEEVMRATRMPRSAFVPAARYVLATLGGHLPPDPPSGAPGWVAVWNVATFLGASLARRIAEGALVGAEGADLPAERAVELEGTLVHVPPDNPVSIVCWKALCCCAAPEHHARLAEEVWFGIARGAKRAIWPALCEGLSERFDKSRGRSELTDVLMGTVRAILGKDVDTLMGDPGLRGLLAELPPAAVRQLILHTPGVRCHSENSVVAAMMWYDAHKNGGLPQVHAWINHVRWYSVANCLRCMLNPLYGVSSEAYGGKTRSFENTGRVYDPRPLVLADGAKDVFFDGAWFELSGGKLSASPPVRQSDKRSFDVQVHVVTARGELVWCDPGPVAVRCDADGAATLMCVA